MRFLFYLLVFLLLTSTFTFGQVEEFFVYDDKGRPDPFLALVDEKGKYLFESEASGSFYELRLLGILYDPQGDNFALINDRIVGIGELVSGFVIKKITRDNIIVSKDGQEHIIWLSIEGKRKEREDENK